MATPILTAKQFQDEESAFAYVEAALWPERPHCPHCGGVERISKMKGIYQHCSEKHLHRYVAEFDFRYNNRIRLGIDDLERTDRTLKGVKGKRLTYRTTA